LKKAYPIPRVKMVSGKVTSIHLCIARLEKEAPPSKPWYFTISVLKKV